MFCGYVKWCVSWSTFDADINFAIFDEDFSDISMICNANVSMSKLCLCFKEYDCKQEPFIAAKCSAVFPSSSFVLTSALYFMRILAIFAWPKLWLWSKLNVCSWSQVRIYPEIKQKLEVRKYFIKRNFYLNYIFCSGMERSVSRNTFCIHFGPIYNENFGDVSATWNANESIPKCCFTQARNLTMSITRIRCSDMERCVSTTINCIDVGSVLDEMRDNACMT